MYRIKKNLKGLLLGAVILVPLSFIVLNASASSFSSITSDSIKEKQQSVQKAKENKDKYKSNLTNVQSIKNKLQKEKNNLLSYIKELDASLNEIEEKLTALNEDIAIKEEELAETTAELEEWMRLEETRKQAMYSRIKLMYENKSGLISSLLADIGDFGKVLNKADYLEKVVDYDHEKWEEYKDTCEIVSLIKEELEIDKALLEEEKNEAQAEADNLEELISEKNKTLDEYDNNISNQDALIKEYEAEIKAEEEEIKALEALISSERKAIVAANGIVLSYDGGAFTFPVASYTRVSDDYGNRIHPILKTKQFHNGVDLAAPKGTAIYAAYDGIIVSADYSATMGNYVMIDHGNGVVTIYMHASKHNVKKDDIVARGDKIAEVGSTGRSTGNHLHFSVRVDGEYQSPWNYISKK